MKKTIFLLVGLVLAMCSIPAVSQNTVDVRNNEDAYRAVAVMPRFPGGTASLLKCLSDLIVYPEQAVNDSISGTVLIQFIVKTTGHVKDVKVVRSVHPLLDAEAVRVVKALPPFTPGRLESGEPVNVWYTLPITFKL